jgi:phosphotriesterase-related protein
MSVMTVQGPIDADRLGVVSPHEHLLIDIRNQFTPFAAASRRALSEKPVSLGNLDALSRNPYAVQDNLVLNDVALAEQELLRFKRAGGDTVVEATSIGIGRDPEALLGISRATGINIIAGCGYYTADTHPSDMPQRMIAEIRDEILADLTTGIDGTRIRAGVIGEIGTSAEILPDEHKTLLAAAEAQRETGVGIIVHTYPWSQRGLDATAVLTESGVPPGKVAINHVDVEIDLDYCKRLCDTGVFIEFDNFGKEYYIDRRDRGFAGGIFARDVERVQAIKALVDAGYLDHILMANDVCLKTLLHRYGGWGYDHVLTHIVPMLLDDGLTEAQLDVLLRGNPARFLETEIVMGITDHGAATP